MPDRHENYEAVATNLPTKVPQREKCARDSEWCDGAICRKPPHGNGIFPDCPNADPEPAEQQRKEASDG